MLYQYTADLLCLDFSRPMQPHVCQDLYSISTPLCWDALATALASHPDQAFAGYITDGLRFGFRIGFQYISPLRSATSNMFSARMHLQVVTDYLQAELSRGRMLGPFHSVRDLPPLQINRFGVIPKGHNTGKWRLITDLSFPRGRSVNDGIDPSLCSLSYTTVDDIAATMATLGVGALIAKVDVESAYRLIPVHIHMIAHFKLCCGRGKFTLTRCSHSGFARPPKFSMLSPMLSTGTYSGRGSPGCFTTWMVLSSLGPLTQVNVLNL